MEFDRDKYIFLHPHHPYRGDVKPENLVFNAERDTGIRDTKSMY